MISSEDHMTQLNQPGTYHRHVDYEAGTVAVISGCAHGELIAELVGEVIADVSGTL